MQHLCRDHNETSYIPGTTPTETIVAILFPLNEYLGNLKDLEGRHWEQLMSSAFEAVAKFIKRLVKTRAHFSQNINNRLWVSV